jgi:hypothetical protein
MEKAMRLWGFGFCYAACGVLALGCPAGIFAQGGQQTAARDAQLVGASHEQAVSSIVLAPVTVNFQLTAGGSSLMSHSVSSQNGVAWFRANSGKSAGALQVVASLGDASARRIVQQVASDPCNLRIKGQRTAKGIVIETEPVRDCAGNPVPDGTVVTFTAKNGKETSTVDAPIKQGIARAQMTAAGPVSISAASGVVMGNELHLGAQ